MSALAKTAVVFLTIVAIHGASATAQDQHPLPGGKDRWATKAVARNGVELSVEVDRQGFAGGPLVVRITICNNGKDKLRLVDTGVHKFFAMKMFSANGTAVPMTRFGKKRMTTQGTGGSSRNLSPGMRYGMVYNLARLFDLTVSEEYSLRVSKKYWSHDLSQSAGLKLEVGVNVREPNSKDFWKAPKD